VKKDRKKARSLPEWLRKYITYLIRKIHPYRRVQNSRLTRYHGSDYGGWVICQGELDQDSVIFSIGMGEDASFDRSVMKNYGVKLFAFDPTPRSIDWVASQTWPPEFSFYPYGLAAQNGSQVFYSPENPDHVSHSLLGGREHGQSSIEVEFRTISTLAEMTGSSTIDLLKMDIEGAEYGVIQDIVTQKDVNIQQILVEFHHFFPEISFKETIRAIRSLNRAGYKIFHVSNSGHEYGFIKIK